jgi:hypothetical protein
MYVGEASLDWHCQVNVNHGHVGNYLDAEVVRPLPRRST